MARIRESKYRPSPMPNGGLEIPLLSLLKKVTVPEKFLKKNEKKGKRALYWTREKKSNNDMPVHFEANLVPGKQSTESKVDVDDSPKELAERENGNEIEVIEDSRNEENITIIVID